MIPQISFRAGQTIWGDAAEDTQPPVLNNIIVPK